MGISDLWTILHPTSTTLSLRKLAVDAFTSPHRAFRLGIDISLWLRHAQHVSYTTGANPYLRTLFYRFAALMSQGFVPIFVFDGPHRPSLKRGKRVFGNAAPPMFNDILILLRAFGFEARQAPGEAEAELAYMSQRDEIDAVLTDDSDALVFGAKVVIRNWSTTLSGHVSNRKQQQIDPDPEAFGDDNDDKASMDADAKLANDIQNSDKFVPVYRAEKIEADLQLDRKKLILFALLAGGDYHMQGLPGCGKAYSYSIAAKTDLADILYGALQDELKNSEDNDDNSNNNSSDIDSFDDSAPRLQEVADNFVAELAHLLTYDPNKIFGKKKPSLAKKLQAGDGDSCIPDWQVMNRYANPITSYNPKYALIQNKNNKKKNKNRMITTTTTNKILTTSSLPDVAKLTEIMQEYLEFTPAEVLQRFRSILFSGLIMEEMRRAILRQDQTSPSTYSLNPSPPSPIIVMPSSSPPSSPLKSVTSTQNTSTTIDSFFKSTKPNLRINLDMLDKDDSDLFNAKENDGIIRFWEHVEIKNERQHWNTDKTLEYRAEILPSKCVSEIRKHLWPEEINVKKIRQRKTEETREKALEVYRKEFPDRVVKKSSSQQKQTLENDPDWLNVLEKVQQESLAKKRNRRYDDPDSSLRIWLPANAVEMVYRDAVKFYQSKKEVSAALSRSKLEKSKSKSRSKTPVKKKNIKSKSPSPKSKSPKLVFDSLHPITTDQAMPKSTLPPSSSSYHQTEITSIFDNDVVSGAGEVINLDSSDDDGNHGNKDKHSDLPELQDLFKFRKKRVHVEPEVIDLVSD